MSAEISITAKAEAYRAEIAKLPGWTDKEAKKAADALTRRLKQGQAQAVFDAQEASRAATANAQTQAARYLKGAALGVGVGAAAFATQLAMEVSTAQREIALLSQSTGIARETLDGLRLGAKLAGVDFGAVADVFEDFSGSVTDFARDGSGKGQKVFAELGVDVRDAGGELRGTNEVLLDTIRKIQGLESPTQRAGYYVQLFSDKAGQLQAVLNGTDIDHLVRAAERFGVASGQSAENADRWRRATGGLQVALEYAANTVMQGLFGVGAAQALEHFTLGFVNAFTFLSSYVRGWADDHIAAIQAVWSAMTLQGSAIEAGKAVIDALNPVDNLQEAKAAAMEAAEEWHALARAQRETAAATQQHTRAQLVDTSALKAAEAERDKAAREAERRAREEQQAYDRLTGVVEDYRARGLDAWQQIGDRRDRAIAALGDLVVSERTATQAAVAESLIRQDAWREEIALRQKLQTELQEQADKYRQDQAEAEAEHLQKQKEAAEEAKRLEEERRDTQRNAWSSALDYASQAIGGVIELFNTQTREGRAAALALFAVQKAVSVATIAVNTAQAITAALTIPPPAGPVLAVATGVAAAVQLAAALAAQPRFHGGMYGAGMSQPGLAADESTAVVRRGEVVVPKETVREVGGPDRVRKRLREDRQGVTIVRAVFSDREVMVPLARETAWHMPRDPLMGWRDG